MITSFTRQRDEPEKVVKARFNVQKSYEGEQRLVFGWANVSARANGEKITDWREDIIDIDELERSSLSLYLSFYGDGGGLHERGSVATMIREAWCSQRKTQSVRVA